MTNLEIMITQKKEAERFFSQIDKARQFAFAYRKQLEEEYFESEVIDRQLVSISELKQALSNYIFYLDMQIALNGEK